MATRDRRSSRRRSRARASSACAGGATRSRATSSIPTRSPASWNRRSAPRGRGASPRGPARATSRRTSRRRFCASPLGDHAFLNATKARTQLLPPALTAAGLPGLPYTRYHEIAAVMQPEEIHPEVRREARRHREGVRPDERLRSRRAHHLLGRTTSLPSTGTSSRARRHAVCPAGVRRSYYYRPSGPVSETDRRRPPAPLIELKLVSRDPRAPEGSGRPRAGPGVTRTTLELLDYWTREGRQHRLFFAQREAAETVIFLTEARARLPAGHRRSRSTSRATTARPRATRASDAIACKMATGTGKTTVMAMLAAWSILNKVGNRADARFSDVVLVVCPNVTIRSRLRELDPREGDASLYRTRDLVPAAPDARPRQGPRARHQLARVRAAERAPRAGSARKSRGPASRSGRVETITIGAKTTTARGRRYLTPEELERQIARRARWTVDRARTATGTATCARSGWSPCATWRATPRWSNRVLGREVGGKQNVLVFNDEAHHAYRIRRDEPDEGEGDELFGEPDDAGRVLPGSDGVGRRARSHPEAAGHQRVRGPLGDAVLPGAHGARTRTGSSRGW